MTNNDGVAGQGQQPEKRKWYARVSTWLLATLLAGAATFGTAAVADLLKAGVESVRGPVEIAVARHKDCPFSYVVPGEADRVRPAPDPNSSIQAVEDWARSVGGVDGGFTTLDVTVTGSSERPVTLHGLEVEVVARDAPIQGFQTAIACGEAIPLRIISINLDLQPPAIVESVDNRNIGGDAPNTPERPIRFPYRVDRTTSEVFRIYVFTESCNCRWRARIRWQAGSDSGTSVIDDSGQPFRTHAVANLPTFGFNEPPLSRGR
jgi:hypothetical protein